MNTKVLLTATMLSVFFFGAIGAASVAFAQYMGNVGDEGQTGSYTLEEALEIQRRRIETLEANPSSGSGTPYLDASGVVGAAVIAGASLVVLQEPSSLEEDLANTQQWAEDKYHFSLILLSSLSGY